MRGVTLGVSRLIATVAVMGVLSGSAWAQPTLIVNGRQIEGNTTEIVSGASYAPATTLASALGAVAVVDPTRGTAVLDAGGRLLQLAVVSSAAEARAATDAIRLDGVAIPGPAAVATAGDVFLPVKQVAEALGATVTFMSTQNAVVVVQPRARLTAMRRLERPERIELTVSAPVRHSAFFNAPVDALQIHLERTDVEVQLRPLEGEWFAVASAVAAGGGTDVRVQLVPGATYEVYQVPDGRGFRLVVAFGAVGESPLARGLRVVLDPGHGGQDAGLVLPEGSESSLVLQASARVAALLRQRGYDVVTTRDGDFPVPMEVRSSAGIGSDLFVSLHVADLPAGAFNAYFLGEAPDVESLNVAVRENAGRAAATETDELRRELLLGLVPDLEGGRLVVEELVGQLFTAGGYRVDTLASVPLQVLGGAAGRGMMLEFSAVDLASQELADALAAAIAEVLTRRLSGTAR